MTIFLGLCPMKGRFRFSFACDFSCGEPPRYALRFPPIPMRLLTQWIQWLLGVDILRIPNIESELCFPQSKVAKKHFFFSQFVFVQSLAPTHFFLPQKILWRKKNRWRFHFVSVWRATPQEYFNAMQVGIDGREQWCAGRVGVFFLKFGRETLFHCFTWHMEVQSLEIHLKYMQISPFFKTKPQGFSIFWCHSIRTGWLQKRLGPARCFAGSLCWCCCQWNPEIHEDVEMDGCGWPMVRRSGNMNPRCWGV